MIRLWLVRHGKTPGNKLARYIGVTDESLCQEGEEFLRKQKYPDVQKVYVSPLKRCIQTAQILFPKKEMCVITELAECNFGEFENKNYKELAGNEKYQAWIDSNGMLPFPGGESREECKNRNLRGFEKAVEDCICEKISQAALVIHGGTIMNLMEEYADIQKSFYEWHVENGCGYEVTLDEKTWKNGKKELIVQKNTGQHKNIVL